MAEAKARAVGGRFPLRSVLAADTAVVVGPDVLGKPLDGADATRMLELLSGRDHEVLTAVSLLAPNGRPVQTTRDLRSFWTRTYPEVRKELRGRYPKHPWPEDPWTATATHKTVRRR